MKSVEVPAGSAQMTGDTGSQKHFFDELGWGSRRAVYSQTEEIGASNSGHASGKLFSVSAMPAYSGKCHEELRWEDYRIGLASTAVEYQVSPAETTSSIGITGLGQCLGNRLAHTRTAEVDCGHVSIPSLSRHNQLTIPLSTLTTVQISTLSTPTRLDGSVSSSISTVPVFNHDDVVHCTSEENTPSNVAKDTLLLKDTLIPLGRKGILGCAKSVLCKEIPDTPTGFVADRPVVPLDLVRDILSWLRPRCIAICSCVCKEWRVLTNEQSFKELTVSRTKLKLIAFCSGLNYLQSLPTQKSGSRQLFCVDNKDVLEMDSPLGRSLDVKVVLVGSCKGIVGLMRGNVLFLWNPWTREYKATEFKSHLGSQSSIHGFGLSENSGFYVMRFVNAMSSSSFVSTLRVFSVENPTSVVSMEVPFTLVHLLEPGVFSNGSVFWVGRDSDGYSIIEYSLDEGKVKKVSTPSCLSGDAYVIPAVLKENLCILTKDVSSRDIDIWNRVCTKSWVKIFTINVAAFRTPIKSTPWPYNERYVVPIQMEGEEILFKHGAEVYWLDTKEEGDRELEIEDKIQDWSERYILLPYIPSLLSLDSGCFVASATDTLDALLLLDAQACQDFKDKMSPSLESLNHVNMNGDEVHPPPPKTLLPPSPTTT